VAEPDTAWPWLEEAAEVAGVIPVPTEEDTSAEGATALSLYFREMAMHRVLTADEELVAVREIEELEIVLWERLFSLAPAVDHLISLTEKALLAASQTVEVPTAAFRALRQAATAAKGTASVATRHKLQRAARRVAERVRAIDVDMVAVQAVMQVLHEIARSGRPVHGQPALAAGRPAFRAYVKKVEEASHAATRSRERFIKANLRLVVSMARRYRRDLLSLADLIQEGNIGLMKGVARYDHRRGVKFSTYASWWIRHAINRALAEKGREVRIPVHLLDAQQRLAKAERELGSKLGRQGTSDELAEVTQLPVERIERMRTYVRDHILSLDHPTEDKEERALLERFQSPDRDDKGMLEQIAEREMIGQLPDLMHEVLRPIESDILRWRFGLDDDREMTLKEIGQKYNLSRERVRQLQEQALDKIRGALRERHAV
jgi:RNA polymerase primary sigma factor